MKKDGALRSRAPGLVRIALASASMLAALLLLEIGLRWRAHVANAGLMEEALESQPEIPPGKEVHLGHIVRYSDNPEIVYELRSNLEEVSFRGAPVSTNAFGFRSPLLAIPKPPGTVRIVGIGDSVMFGQGVTYEETYLAVLARSLNERHPGVRWEVLNTGVPGYNTTIEVETLAARALAYEPDLVLLGLVVNDLELPRFLRARIDPFELSRCFLWEWVRERLARKPEEPFEPGGELHPGLGELPWSTTGVDAAGELVEIEGFARRYEHMLGWEAFERALDRLQELSRREGFEVVAFADQVVPVTLRMLEEAGERGWTVASSFPRLLRFMRENDVEHYLTSELVVSKDDAHPSALAHAMMAEALLEALEKPGKDGRTLVDRLQASE